MKLSYGRQSIDEDDIRAVVEALRGDFLTAGPLVEEFERELALACGARHAVVVANGTLALHLACLAAGIQSGDEGITTPMTFAASANCIATCGGTPRFVDIRSDTWNIDPDRLEAAITTKTRVIVPVHFGGLPCDLAEIRAIADKYRITVIADACHAIGATYHGNAIGGTGFAHMTCLSFHPVKHITTAEGGAILTDDEGCARKLRTLRHHGFVNEPGLIAAGHGGWYHEMQSLGTNARLSDVQCALGLSQLRKLPAFVARRRDIASRYRAAFSDLGIVLQAELPDRSNAYHLFVVWLDPKRCDRRHVYDELRKRDIYAQVHYIPVHLHPYYRDRYGTAPGQFPNAERSYQGALSLPMYPSLRNEDVGRVIESVRQVLS